MEMYKQKGEDRKDCELQILARYNKPFKILSVTDIRRGGFLGLFTKPGVEVEFYFLSHKTNMASMNTYYQPSRDTLTYAADSGAARHRQYIAPDIEEEKRKVLAAANGAKEAASAGKESSQQLLDLFKTLNDKIDKVTVTGNKNEEHPAFVRARELLKANDFSEKFIKKMIDKLRAELSLEQLDKAGLVMDRLVEWIGESISIYKEDAALRDAQQSFPRKPKVMVLVGPTGVGKTTTLSKLAAIYGIGTDDIPAIDVKMITIDAFRICAKEQLEQIGNIMQIPVSCVVNKSDLRKEIDLHSGGTDMFLIDTIGKSPKDSAKLGEMKEILDGAPRNAEFHLVVSAATKTSDIENIMQQFEPFNYKSVIFTKMDETDRIGNIVSALAEKRKSISYITVGQSVPADIRRASVVNFLINLDGFIIDREKIEERFPSGEADQFKWR